MFKLCIETDLTEGQKAFLEAICDHILTHKKAPTLDEMATSAGVSYYSAQRYAQILRRKGFVSISKSKPHPIRVHILA